MATSGFAAGPVERSRELARVEQLLRDNRLVTVMGAPGAGKTHLALAVATRLADRLAGGVHVCELAPIASPALVRSAIATALGLAPEAGGDLGTVIRHRLGDRPTLIVVDNCEHVRAEVAETMSSILSASSGYRVLATSRERLRADGETAWTLPTLSQGEALQLLALRVRAVDALFEVTEGNRADLVEICDRLERLPLAIELVAPRLALLPAREVAHMLSTTPDLLSRGEGPGRHRTMTAALDWSVALLPTTAALDLWRLSVFPATFPLAAAATVLETSSAQALDRLAVLRDASLLTTDTSGALAKFRLLEPVRQYALAHLAGGPIEDEVRRLHASYVLGRAEWIGARLLGTPEQAAALEAFIGLLPDLRQAVDWCQYGQPSWAGAIMANTGWAWEMTTRLREGEALERRALDVTRDPAVRAGLLVRLASLVQRWDIHEPAELAYQAINEARKGDSPRELGLALCLSGAYDLSDDGEAKFREATAIAERTGDPLIEVSVNTFRRSADLNVERANQERAVALVRGLGDTWLTVQATVNLIQVCLEVGDVASAKMRLGTILPILIQHPDWLVAIFVLSLSARVATRTGRAAEALRLISARRRLGGDVGLPSEPLAAFERDARGALGGQSKAEKHLEEGGRLTLPDALKLALEVVETPAQFASRRTPRRDPATGLTQREGDVVRLVAAGLTNREIATRLFITERSAEGHVERIRNKLGVHSRRDVASWAEKHDLAPALIEQR